VSLKAAMQAASHAKAAPNGADARVAASGSSPGADGKEAAGRLRPSPLKVGEEPPLEVEAQYTNDFFDETLASMLSAKVPNKDADTASEAKPTRSRALKDASSRAQEASKGRETATGIGVAKGAVSSSRPKGGGAAAAGAQAIAAVGKGPAAKATGVGRGSVAKGPSALDGGKVHEFSGAVQWLNGFDSRFDDALKKADALDQF
jgi:hypothetical protein